MSTNEQNLPAFPSQQEGDSGRLDIGFKGSESPRIIPLGATQDMQHVRFEGGAIRKDFGFVGLGDPASSNIQAMGEHGVLIAPSDPEGAGRYAYYLYRIVTVAGQPVIETFNTQTLEWEVRTTLRRRGFRSRWTILPEASNPNPRLGEAGFDTNQTDFLVNKLDQTGQDQSAELAKIVGGGYIQIGGQLWNVISATDNGGSVSFELSPVQDFPPSGLTEPIYFTYPETEAPVADTVSSTSDFLSTVSIQDALAVANGLDPIMVWLNRPILQLAQVNFSPLGQPLKADINFTGTIVEPTPILTDYTFSYEVSVDAASTVDSVTLTLETVINNEISRGRTTVTVPTGNTLESFFTFEDELDVGDQVVVKVVQLKANGTTPRQTTFDPNYDVVAGVFTFETPLETTDEIAGEVATFDFAVTRNILTSPGDPNDPTAPPPGGGGGGGGTGDEDALQPVLNPTPFNDPTWALSLWVSFDGGAFSKIFERVGIVSNEYKFFAPFSVPLNGSSSAGGSVQFQIRVNNEDATPATFRLTMGETQTVDWLEGSFTGNIAIRPLSYNYVASTEDFFAKITPENFPGQVDGQGFRFGGASVDAPRAKYLGSFGDRLFALWEGNDKQILNASSDGNILQWENAMTGNRSFNQLNFDDSVNLSLIDNRIDPIDDLQWILPVSSGIAILARQRSMMRVSETQNPDLAVSATHWIEGVGAEAPYAACQVENGIMFLAANRMVYYMTADRLLPVGQDIQEELLKHYVPGNREDEEAACCAYDFTYQEWILSVPWDGSTFGRRWFAFDVRHFLTTQETRWRRRAVTTVRMTNSNQIIRNNLVSGGPSVVEGPPRPLAPNNSASAPKENFIIFAQPNLQVQLVSPVAKDLDGITYQGKWESPTLNRGPMGNEATLRTLGFQYSAEAATSFIIELSGDGGRTYTERHTLQIESTQEQVRRIRKAVNTTGYDLRFRILFPEPEIVKIFSYYPSIVERGRLVL